MTVETNADYCHIMPCLDVKNGRVVKGVHFVDLVDAADPVEAASAYDADGADELALLDIAATLESRPTTLDLVARVARTISVPLTVGGGISALEDIAALLDAGASAVSISSAAVKNPELVRQAADRFGSAVVTVAIDARRSDQQPSGYELVTHGGTHGTGTDVFDWARRVAELGAGRILATSMETDGVKRGYDIALTAGCAEASGLPIVASGGAGELQHFYDAATAGHASALLAASVFHFGTFTVAQVKQYLHDRGVPVRL